MKRIKLFVWLLILPNGFLKTANSSKADVVLYFKQEDLNELSSDKLENFLIQAIRHGENTIVRIILNSPKFNEISPEGLGNVLRYTNNEAILRRILDHPRFNEVRHNFLFYGLLDAARNGNEGIVSMILENSRLGRIPQCFLGVILQSITDLQSGNFTQTHENIFRMILRDPIFNEIDPDVLGDALSNAAKNGHYNIVNMILEDPRFKKIYISFFIKAFENAVENNHINIVGTIMNHPRFKEINIRGLMSLFDYAVENNNRYIIGMIMGHERFKEIPSIFVREILAQEDVDF